MKRKRQWLLKRAELARADVIHHRRKWGWSYTPTDWARTGTQLDRLDKRIARLEETP